MRPSALVVLNGEYQSHETLKKQIQRIFGTSTPDIVVGVDGGVTHLRALDVVPTHIIGDFDSILNTDGIKQEYPDAKWIEYLPEKDFTDSELALEILSQMDCELILVVGAFGGRLDHMMGTIFLLNRYASEQNRIIMIDNRNQMELLTGPIRHVLNPDDLNFKYVSFIPITQETEGITLKGFKYPLNEARVKMGETVGISNEIIQETAQISFRSGKLLMIFSKDQL